MEIRSMEVEDLEAVAEVADLAFIDVIARLSGSAPERPFFPPAGLALRVAADPGGCLVATIGGEVAGALFSVSRGTLAWLGPVAVSNRRQGAGVGQALVGECQARWSEGGVRLMGLETFPNSPFHLHLYAKLGFRPGWTGVQLVKQLDGGGAGTAAEPAPPLQHPRLPLPDLDFLYAGFDPAAEVRATLERGAGRIFASDRGLAVLHLRDAFHTSPGQAFIPLLAGRDAGSFASLLQACEDAAGADGKRSIAVRLPGSCWNAFRALTERGYRAGGAMLRMKAGENLDYDRDAWYCDDWL